MQIKLNLGTLRSILTLVFAGMLFFWSPAGAQTMPAGLDCDPFPEEDGALMEQCTYYMGLNRVDNYDSDPNNNSMPAQKPANCDPLPLEDASLMEQCTYYMGIQNNAIYAPTGQNPPAQQPQQPVNPPAQQSGTPANQNADATGLGALVSQVYLYALGISGLLAVVVAVWGSYLVMTARGNAAQAQEGRNRIYGGLTGMILLAGAYILLNTINTDLTDLNADFDELNPPAMAPR
jgi:hypothetical protein